MYKTTIIQYWADPAVPEDIKQLTDTWKHMNPQCKHKIFNQNDAANFIKENFSKELYTAFLSVKLPAMEADIFRVAYILKNGGLYIDCATQCFSPLDKSFMENSKLVLLQKWHGGIWNGLIYSREAKNDILEEIWHTIQRNIITKKEGNIIELTGPRLFQNIVEKDKNINKVLLYKQEAIDSTIEGTFTLVRALKHRGAKHWSRMQNIEPLYTTTFNYKVKPIAHIEKIQKKRIVIYAGQQGTDVSYLQAYLSFLHKKNNHFCYPETGRTLDKHDKMASILSSTNQRAITLFFKNFYDEIAQCPEKVIIISSELFSSFNVLKFNKTKSTRLWQRLHQLIAPFYSKEIVYHIAEQSDSIEERIHAMIQGPMCLQKINIKMMMHHPMLDHSLFYTALQKYFPDTKISYKIWKPALSHTLLFNDLFSHSVDIDQHIPWSWNKKRNRIIPSNILANLFIAVNRTTYTPAEKIKLKNVLLRYLPDEGGISFLSPIQKKEIQKNFTSANKEIDVSFTQKNMLHKHTFEHNEAIDVESLISNYLPQYKNRNIYHLDDLFTVILNNNLSGRKH